jgi:hypothetical protein
MSIKSLRLCNNVQTSPFVIDQKLGNMNPLALQNISTSMFWSFELSSFACKHLIILISC